MAPEKGGPSPAEMGINKPILPSYDEINKKEHIININIPPEEPFNKGKEEPFKIEK